MLNAPVCPLTIAISSVGIAIALAFAKKSKQKPSSIMFAAITSLIFALQMLNYPIQNGTSGHLIGAMIAVCFLSVPFAILSISIVLLIQAFFFGDGGINVLGANILNMALISAGLLGYLYSFMKKKKVNETIALGIASFLSVIAAAFACSLELALSDTIALSKVLPAMMSVHTLVALGETALTVLIAYLLHSHKYLIKKSEYSFALATFSLTLIAVFMTPFASEFPDGLEWIAEQLSFNTFSNFEISAIFSDYQIAFIGHSGISTIIAGIAGILITCGSSISIGKAFMNLDTFPNQ